MGQIELFNHLLKIIVNSYLKPFTCVQVIYLGILDRWIAQLAEAVEYTNCISAEEYDFPNECPGYDIKQSDGEASVMLEYSFIAITPRSTLTWNKSIR